ncbi:MAG: AraC family transcriptional regulator [Clostridia bacterium]|nr:AraC family transcriptional regulator [Clostridia bacterium]
MYHSCSRSSRTSYLLSSQKNDIRHFDNYSYFCRNFKKYMGKSPKEFFFNNFGNMPQDYN